MDEKENNNTDAGIETKPVAEAPKAEAPKAEAPKAEAPKAEAPKAEAPKAATDEVKIDDVGPGVETPETAPEVPALSPYEDSRAKDRFQTRVLKTIEKYPGPFANRMTMLKKNHPDLYKEYADDTTDAVVKRYKAKLKKRKKAGRA